MKFMTANFKEMIKNHQTHIFDKSCIICKAADICEVILSGIFFLLLLWYTWKSFNGLWSGISAILTCLVLLALLVACVLVVVIRIKKSYI